MPCTAGSRSSAGLSKRIAADGVRTAIVFDEFPYLCDAHPALPSIVQKLWDELQATPAAAATVAIALCGSRVSFMGRLLAEKHPLYGRQTAYIDLAPLSLREAGQSAPGWTVEDRIGAFGVFGGIPSYLALADPGASLAENIRRLILTPGGPLHEEPEHVRLGELHEGRRYVSVQLARGDSRLPGILAWRHDHHRHVHPRAVHRIVGKACVLHTHMPYATALTLTRMRAGHHALAERYAPSRQCGRRRALQRAGAWCARGRAHRPRDARCRRRLLGNHGVIVCGERMDYAYEDLCYLERACQVQMIAAASGLLQAPAEAVVVADVAVQTLGERLQSTLFFVSLRRRLPER